MRANIHLDDSMTRRAVRKKREIVHRRPELLAGLNEQEKIRKFRGKFDRPSGQLLHDTLDLR